MTQRNGRPSTPRAVVTALAAVGVGLASARGRGRKLDDRLFERINADLSRPALDLAFRVVTEAGSIWASAGAATALAGRGRRAVAVDAFGAACAMWTVGQLMKRAFRRLRPYETEAAGLRLLINRPSGASWPSSHPAVLATFVTVAARDLDLPPRARAALAALVIGVGVSRVYLGVHYPADVLGGLLLSRALADLWSV
ncbi:MAG: phosphatase PAP2 family protein, partial [Actinomycetota bacterium]